MTDPKSLPDVPDLVGPSNLDHWSDMLRSKAANYGLSQHLQFETNPNLPDEVAAEVDFCDRKITFIRDMLRDSPGHESSGLWRRELKELRNERETKVKKGGRTSEWIQGQSAANLLIKGSIAKVRDQLLAAGWDPDPDGLRAVTPKEHYDFILREVPKMKDAVVVVEPSPSSSDRHPGDLVHDLCHIDRNNYDSLAAYQTNLSSLCRQLVGADLYLDEKILLWIVINGLRKAKGYRWWASCLTKDMMSNKLTWESLMKEMSTRAIKEQRVGASPRHAASSPGCA